MSKKKKIIILWGACIAVFLGWAVPAFIRAHSSCCVCELEQIEGAKATWALEAKKVNSDSPADTELYGSTAYIRVQPSCPASGTYTVGNVDTRPACSLAASEGHTL